MVIHIKFSRFSPFATQVWFACKGETTSHFLGWSWMPIGTETTLRGNAEFAIDTEMTKYDLSDLDLIRNNAEADGGFSLLLLSQFGAILFRDARVELPISFSGLNPTVCWRDLKNGITSGYKIDGTSIELERQS